MAAVTTMPVMHEHVHEGASEERQPDEGAQNVSAVLGEQKRTDNHEKAEQDEPCSRS